MKPVRTFFVAIGIAAPLLIGCGKKAAAPQATPTEISEFFSALQDGDAEIVSRLLKAKPYLANTKNESGETPLQVAKKKDNQELVDVLKKNGAE
jgi:hypothetical protein